MNSNVMGRVKILKNIKQGGKISSFKTGGAKSRFNQNREG